LTKIVPLAVLIGIDDPHDQPAALRSIEHQATPHLVRRRKIGANIVQARPQSTFCDGVPACEPIGAFGMPGGGLPNRISTDHIMAARV